MATYLITGGCGFIGSHLAGALIKRRHDVRILDNLSTGRIENAPPGADLVIGDVGDRDTVIGAMRGVTGCFHLAAVVPGEPDTEDGLCLERPNFTGAINVFAAAAGAAGGRPARVVYASSASVYGDNASVPLRESAMPRPLTPYGADKLASEFYGRVAGLLHGVTAIGFRMFNVYGPRQRPDCPYSGVVSRLCRQVVDGEPLKLLGDGSQGYDFVFVTDVVRFLVAAMERSDVRADVFNLCTGRQTTARQLADILRSIVGNSPPVTFGPGGLGGIRTNPGDPARAVRAFGVGAATDLSLGLKEMLDAHREALVVPPRPPVISWAEKHGPVALAKD